MKTLNNLSTIKIQHWFCMLDNVQCDEKENLNSSPVYDVLQVCTKALQYIEVKQGKKGKRIKIS